jgi:PEGA domain
MTDEKKSFWTTLPGILTGLAALITAVGGIILLLNHKPKDDSQVNKNDIKNEKPITDPDNEICSPTYGLEGSPVVPGTGEIFISSGSSSAQGARVYLNGKCQERMLKRGEGALILLTQIPPGNYFIKVSKSGYKDFSRDILVKTQERSSVPFDLQQ